VWVKGESFPGLAMSRSLGDAVAHTVGVSSIPEVKSFLVGVDDKFIVIGSDGVWEFLTNENIAEIVFPFYKLNQPETAANEIVR
jgi:serine/threonine protein phosphatase PrpC|tara:strand:- start:272 stop:523 length:252 start_codon:yes stop_codon:yes gene_type:complete